jgi:hypothetical protein
MAKDRGNVTPLLRLGRGQGEHCRFHTAGFPQGDNEMPMLGGDGILDLFLVVATVRSDDDLTRIIGTDRVFQVQLLDVLHHEVMLSAIRQRMIPARALAIERDGTQRNQHVIEDQYDIGPLMTNDKSLAMIERLGVCWRQTGAMLERTIHDNRHIPGQLFQLLPGFGNVLGLVLGEALQRRDCDLTVGFQPLRELRLVQSGKPGGFFEGMFRSHDHQKQQITGADPLKTSADPDTPRDPSL